MKQISSVVILASASLFSRILGIMRDHLFARYFGATQGQGIYDLDTYYAAFRIPDLIYQLLIFGTIATAFIPLFSDYIHTEKKEEGWRFANNVLNILLLLLLIIGGLFFLLAPIIVPFFVAGFSPQKIELTVTLTRIMLLSPILFGLSSIFQSIENTFKKFFATAFAPIIYNLSIIGATLIAGQKMGVFALALGVVIGAFLQWIIQIIPTYGLGFRWRWICNLKDRQTQKMFKIILPRIAGLSAVQINLFVDIFIASLLATGSVTILNYAINLNSLPIGIIGVSTAMVTFSTLSEYISKEEHEKVQTTLTKTIHQILALLIPATLGILLLKSEIVKLILGTGKFTGSDVILTENTLAFFALSLFAQGSIPLLARVFYAYKNTKTPVAISFISVILNIILSFSLALYFGLGIYGLALSSSISAILNFSLLLYALKHFLPKKEVLVKPFILGQILLAALCMTAVILTIKIISKNMFIEETFFTLVTTVLAVSVIGFLAYTKALSLLGYKEITLRFYKKKNIDEEPRVS